MSAEERIAELDCTVAEQRQQIAQLQAYVRELEGRLAKDIHNSSKPPASDGRGRRTKSLRRKSGKKLGGPMGHRGVTLRLVATARRCESKAWRTWPPSKPSSRASGSLQPSAYPLPAEGRDRIVLQLAHAALSCSGTDPANTCLLLRRHVGRSSEGQGKPEG